MKRKGPEAGPGGVALFDFDGTLTTCETFPLFVRAAAPRWRVRLGGLLLAPMVLAYRAGWVSGVNVRALIVRLAFSGMPLPHFESACRAFASERFPSLLRPDVMARLREHQARGERVLVVSGNFEALLAPWCAEQGVDCLASRLEVRHGRLTGRYAGPQCAGEAKALRVQELIPRLIPESTHAYGDTPEDFALLALAAHRVYRGERLPAGAMPGA